MTQHQRPPRSRRPAPPAQSTPPAARPGDADFQSTGGPPRFRVPNLIVRVLFLLLAAAAFTGYADRAGQSLMGGTWARDEAFLEKSLRHASGYLVGLMAPKGVLAALESATAEPQAFASKAGSIKVGKLVDGLEDLVHDMWQYMSICLILIMIQIAVLDLVKALFLTVVFGCGALFCGLGRPGVHLFGRIGYALLIVALLGYFGFPLALRAGVEAYERQQMDDSVRLAESIGVLKEKGRDLKEVTLADWREGLGGMLDVMNQAAETAWLATLNVLTGFILMFLLVPLFGWGLIVFVARQAMGYLSSQESGGGLAYGGFNWLWSRFFPRTRRITAGRS